MSKIICCKSVQDSPGQDVHKVHNSSGQDVHSVHDVIRQDAHNVYISSGQDVLYMKCSKLKARCQ
jgi:hypothetical protein